MAPQVLSNPVNFPFFSRTAPPDSEQSLAMVALLRHFGWLRVSILNTELSYSQDFTNAFSNHWKGEHDAAAETLTGRIDGLDTILTDVDNKLLAESLDKALDALEGQAAEVGGRIVLLPMHSEHVWDVLKAACTRSALSETVWVGTDAWIGRTVPADFVSTCSGTSSSLGSILGLSPHINTQGDMHMRYLNSQHAADISSFGSYEPEVIDAVVALCKALDSLPEGGADLRRRNGTDVQRRLRALSFEGVSGMLSFNEVGDRADARYSIQNLQVHGTLPRTLGEDWVIVGDIYAAVGSGSFVEPICWGGKEHWQPRFDTLHWTVPAFGCAKVTAGCSMETSSSPRTCPPDSYDRTHWLEYVVLVLVLLIIIGACCGCTCYQRGKAKLQKQHEGHEKEALSQQAQKDIAEANRNVREALLKQKKQLEAAMDTMQYPATWEAANDDSQDDDDSDREPRLVDVSPETEEYWDIMERLRAPPGTLRGEPNPLPCTGTQMWHRSPRGATTGPVLKSPSWGTDHGSTACESGMEAWITSLKRVQNKYLFANFHAQKERLRRTRDDRLHSSADKADEAENAQRLRQTSIITGNLAQKEVGVFHGTGSTDAAAIYTDKQDGFMMQFGKEGQWGRGLYFAEDALYCEEAGYVTRGTRERSVSQLDPTGHDQQQEGQLLYGESEVLMCSLLLGDCIEMDRDLPGMERPCHELITPPYLGACQAAGPLLKTADGILRCTKPPEQNGFEGTPRYNTVCGYTMTDQQRADGSYIKKSSCPYSRVYIVYENGRALPQYVIRYYRGERDRKRTPYATREEATRPLPDGWERRDHEGRPYYVDKSTRETTWTRPGGANPAARSMRAAAATVTFATSMQASQRQRQRTTSTITTQHNPLNLTVSSEFEIEV